MNRRRLGPLLGAAFVSVGLGLVIGRRRFTRVAVSGHSMEPTLRDGDWLIVDRRARPAQGDIVVAWDPRAGDRLIVKRVRAIDTDQMLELHSDHPAHADEVIGRASGSAIVGRAAFRYRPLERAGFIPRG